MSERALTANGLLIGRVGGAPVRIGASWLIMAGLVIIVIGPQVRGSRPDLGALAYAVAAAYALLLLVSVLVHEAAHALTAKASGLEVHAVVADLWGGHTTFDGERLRPGQAALVAVAGPAANGALGLVAWSLRGSMDTGIPRLLVFALALSNLLLAGFNLLPGLPLDGGQLVEAAVWAVTGARYRGTVVAGWCGRVVAVAVAAYWVVLPIVRSEGLSTTLIWGLVIAGFLWRGASTAIVSGGVRSRLHGVTVDDVTVPLATAREDEPVTRLFESAAGALVVVDPRGVPLGLATATMASELADDRRTSTPVGAVYTRMPDGWVVDVEPGAPLMDLVRRMAQEQRGVVAVSTHGRVRGILQLSDVERLLSGGDRAA